jgi:hypothetical protein
MFGRHSGGVPAVQRQLLLPLDLAAFAAIQRGLHFTTSPPACFSKNSPLNMFRRA